MNGSLVTAILGGISGETTALLALVLSSCIVHQVTAQHRLPTRHVLRTAAITFALIGLLQATIWSLMFHNAYDAPGSWCWTCPPLLDAAGELTENTLTMLLLGSALGLTTGAIRRALRRASYRHIYLHSEHWRAFRRAWWSRHPIAYCTRCWTRASEHHADLHHLTYARLGHERDTDVAPLHRACHIAQHGH